jgi:hypothetical protein
MKLDTSVLTKTKTGVDLLQKCRETGSKSSEFAHIDSKKKTD